MPYRAKLDAIACVVHPQGAIFCSRRGFIAPAVVAPRRSLFRTPGLRPTLAAAAGLEKCKSREAMRIDAEVGMKHTAIRLIEDEHRSLAAVLRAADHLVSKALSTGAAPDFTLLRAILYYLREFPQRRHHRNEDQVLFARIKARTHEADAVIAELEDEHHRGEELLLGLSVALDNWEASAADAQAFTFVLSAFTRFYYAHMEKEESRVLPAAERALSNEDWHEIHAAFESHEDPMFGKDTAEEFRGLFSRIIRLAPPPDNSGESKD